MDGSDVENDAVEIKKNLVSYGNIGSIVTIKWGFDPKLSTGIWNHGFEGLRACVSLILRSHVECLEPLSSLLAFKHKLRIRWSVEVSCKHLCFLGLHGSYLQ
jgi:hypothetical protein